jgi:hypothetical protein
VPARELRPVADEHEAQARAPVGLAREQLDERACEGERILDSGHASDRADHDGVRASEAGRRGQRLARTIRRMEDRRVDAVVDLGDAPRASSSRSSQAHGTP